MTSLPPPSPNRSQSLPYNEISWELFENLCSEILAAAGAGIEIDSELFGLPRKPQYGIDILGRLPDGTCDVVSCKRYKKIAKGKIKTWSDDFLAHWETYWNTHGVNRFILAVAANIKNPDRLDEIEVQKKRFKELGVEFVVWHEKKLDRLLRSQSVLVNQYFDEEYAKRFCGASQGAAKLDLQSEPRFLAFKRNIHTDLDLAIEAYETGNSQQTDVILNRLFGDAEWATLSEQARKDCCRLKIARLLDLDRFDEINELVTFRSITIGPDLQALIILQRSGVDAAVEFVNSTPDVPPAIKSQVLFGFRDFEGALSALKGLDDPLSLATRAKVLAATGEYDDALNAQRSAEAEEPRNAAILKAGLAVRFACSTCRAFQLGVFSKWPEPIQVELIRGDDETLQLLDEAADIAQQYLSAPGLGERDRKDWQVWLLAFLISHPARRTEANELARKLIAEKTSHPGVIVWSLWHGLDIDLEYAKSGLTKGLQGRNPSPDELFVLIMVLESERDIDGATEALSRFAARVRHYPGFAEVQSVWRNHLKGDIDPDTFVLAVQEALTTKSWRKVVKQVRRELDLNSDTSLQHLALTCRLIAQGSDWENIRPLLDDLEEIVGTAVSLEIAIRARINLGEPERALELLERNHEFPGGALPLHLENLKAACLEFTGDTLGALNIRNKLIGSEEDPHGLVLAQTLARSGDVDQFIETVKRVPASKMRPDERLFAANIARARQPVFARRLLKTVLDEETLPDQLVGPALQLAYPLGLEHHTGNLIGRATAGERPIFVPVTYDKVIAHIKETEAEAERLNILYREGVLPMGQFARKVNLSTAAIIYDFADQSGAGILARHGSRLQDEPQKDDRNRYDQAGFRWSPNTRPNQLAVDLPGLMLAERFGFLHELEETFAPIFLPPSLPLALTEEIKSSQHHQPSQIANAELILEALEGGRISVQEGRTNWSGPVVDGSEHAESGSISIDCLKVFFDYQDQNDREIASDQYDLSGKLPDLPEAGSDVLIARGSAEICAGHGILNQLTDRFKIWIDLDERSHISGLCEREKRRNAAYESLIGLQRRIVDGQHSNQYKTARLRGIPFNQSGTDDVEYQLLKELVSLKLDDNTFLFSGDRFLTAFAHTTSAPITDAYSVLKWIESAGKITGAKAREIRRFMRDSNVHFLPYTHDDLVYALKNCAINQGSLIENDALKSFRCHLARAQTYQQWLRLDGSSGRDGQGLELAFARDVSISPIQSIRLVWEDQLLSNEQRIAYSDYIVDFLSAFSLSRLPVNGTDEEKIHFAASLCGTLLSTAIFLGFRPDGLIEIYLGWLRARFDFEQKWTKEPYLTQASRMIKSLLEIFGSDLIGGNLKTWSKVDRMTANLLGESILKLPEAFINELLDNEVVVAIGIRRSETVEIGELIFKKEDFAAALASISDADSLIEAEVNGKEVQGSIALEPGYGHKFRLKIADHNYLLSDPGLALAAAALCPNPAIAFSEIPWITKKEVRQFVETEMAKSKNELRSGEEVALQTYGARILRLQEAFARAADFGKELMDLPKPSTLLREFGCDDSPGALDTTLSTLITETTDESALAILVVQLCSVPRGLPQPLLSKLNTLETPAKSALVDLAIERSTSPVRRTMVRRLSSQLGIDATESNLVELDECKGYIAVFQWLWRQSERDSEWRSLSPEWRLFFIWYHAGEISELFARHGQPLINVSEIIAPWDSRRLVDILLPEDQFTSEVAGPGISGVTLFLALASAGWFDATDNEISKIKQAISVSTTEAVLPEFEALETSQIPDALSSLMSDCRLSPPEWLVEISDGFDLNEADKLAKKILSQAVEDSTEPMNWNLYWHLRRRGAPATERRRVIKYWRSFAIIERVDSNPDWLLTFRGFLMFSNGHLSTKASVDIAEAISQLHSVSRHKKETTEWWCELVASFIVEKRGPDRISGLLKRLDMMFPAMAKMPPIWIKTLCGLACELPFPDCIGVWERVLELRALKT